MDAGTLRALAGPEGADLLAEAVRSYGSESEFALGSRLRKAHPPELVAAALTQARLRQRATAKFAPADAARMFFTVDGYEQATRASVARHRAARIAEHHPHGTVLDLCCGIGGDLVALARAGLTVTGVESDDVTAVATRLNVAALGLNEQASVVAGDATAVDRAPFDVVTCDPARRTTRGRTFDPDAYRPAWSFVLGVLSGTACVKVAPGIPHERIPSGAEAEWISDHGEVKEAALWSGGLAEGGVRRRATILRSGEVRSLTDADDPGGADVRAPGRYLFEPDGAVIRAGLVTAVADQLDGWLLDPLIAYVGSDSPTPTPFARGYRVLDVLPFDLKRLRRYVRERRIGVIVIKKRGVGVTPEELRRALRPQGEAQATLVVTRLAGRAAVLVTEPLANDLQPDLFHDR